MSSRTGKHFVMPPVANVTDHLSDVDILLESCMRQRSPRRMGKCASMSAIAISRLLGYVTEGQFEWRITRLFDRNAWADRYGYNTAATKIDGGSKGEVAGWVLRDDALQSCCLDLDFRATIVYLVDMPGSWGEVPGDQRSFWTGLGQGRRWNSWTGDFVVVGVVDRSTPNTQVKNTLCDGC